MLWILFFLQCVKYIFFWFYQSAGFERNQIVFTLPEAMVINSLVSEYFFINCIKGCAFLEVLGSYPQKHNLKVEKTLCWGCGYFLELCILIPFPSYSMVAQLLSIDIWGEEQLRSNKNILQSWYFATFPTTFVKKITNLTC